MMPLSTPKPVRVSFKSEGEQGGDAVGPIRLEFDDDTADEDTPRPTWGLRSEAVAMAAVLGVPLEEK